LDSFDDGDFGHADGLENEIDVGWSFFSSLLRRERQQRSDRSGSGHAEFGFDSFDEFIEFKNGHFF
jgi:hypothetical protein